ncbi:transglycosylase domain-containing protein [Planktomarina temperata]|uniref:peptidoglycan glycosyltransferase n=1 Tax=Planktomarina temperata RCA23 TaxID=666509 RepID=A0AAN0RIB9_9RHOB|nr:transpeptidase, penicillin binding protein [Planktomarina temperata RCA23]
MIGWRTIYAAIFVATASLGSLCFYILQPPEVGRFSETSQVIRSETGQIMNLRLTSKGFWRERVILSELDPDLIRTLIAYEDQRYWKHHGVDPLALGRAVFDYLKSGKISSGASTLTMQTVRLMDPYLARRTFTAKLRQMLAAIRLDAHWSKEAILEAYFTLAPYGGNIEGVSAASEAWFQKPPKDLRLNEIALLVALPQSPERRRPDRYPDNAYAAKIGVLNKIQGRLNIDDDAFNEALVEQLPARLIKPASYAPHLADRLTGFILQGNNTTIDEEWQKQVQNILETKIQEFPAPIQAAALIVERRTGNVKAYVGSSEYRSEERKGANNFLTAVRSPGSTLKPLIYGKALQRNLIEFNEVFNDANFYRGGYNPTNFDNTYSGKVTLKEALLRSLNIPALITLEKLNPRIFESEIKNLINAPVTSDREAGLSLAVGGFYLNAEQLASLYLIAIDPGTSRHISFSPNQSQKISDQDAKFLNIRAAKQIMHLLIQNLPNGERVAFKTGTSFARHDAWSIQIFKSHVVISWFGTPDNQPTEILTGRDAAFPLSNEIGLALGLKSPEVPKLQISNGASLPEAGIVCTTLIDYPENGAWIKSDNAIIRVIGSQTADWYLNAEKFDASQKQVQVLEPGIQRLTAKSSECSQTNEFFVEFQKEEN